MDLFPLGQLLAQAFTSPSMDDGSISVLVMLCGIVGGWILAGMRQPKAKKVEIDRKDDSSPPPADRASRAARGTHLAILRAMRYLALCCDYDGTLATEGRLTPETVAALERLLASGRRLVMVTGRVLPELQSVCERLDLFERVVVENGALLYDPATRAEEALGPAPPGNLIASLRERGVTPISVGRVIVATFEPHETAVLETIRDLGLELQVIFNKGAVMVLPTGTNKATGLLRALDQMGLSPGDAVGVGDAENDHAFLSACGCAVAVANALPSLKEHADFVTRASRGAGVEELIDELLRDDLAARPIRRA